jgi:hypothetical protein
VGKKNKALKASAQTMKGGEGEQRDEPISPKGWRVIAGGTISVLLGFLALTRADAMGRNWASTVSPLLILGGYALVAVGIFVPAEGEGGAPGPSSLPPAAP